MSKAEEASKRFKNGSVCSQAILTTFASSVDMDEQILHRLGTGFGAGFGRKQLVCGAVSGAVAILSLKFGNDLPGDFKTKEDTYNIVYEFVEQIENQLSDINCKKLLGFPIKEQSDIKRAVSAGVFDRICPKCIEVVAAELEKMI